MKTRALWILTSILVMGSFGQAKDCERGSNCRSATVSGGASLFATTAVAGVLLITSQALANDIIATQDDVFLALDTGVQSTELKSVIARIRLELGDRVAGMTDEDIIANMLSE